MEILSPYDKNDIDSTLNVMSDNWRQKWKQKRCKAETSIVFFTINSFHTLIRSSSIRYATGTVSQQMQHFATYDEHFRLKLGITNRPMSFVKANISLLTYHWTLVVLQQTRTCNISEFLSKNSISGFIGIDSNFWNFGIDSGRFVLALYFITMKHIKHSTCNCQ